MKKSENSPKDSAVKEHLETVLSNDSIFSKTIVVAVLHSKLTLTGQVASIFEKQEVERIAKLTRGVLSVENKLTVPSFYAEAIS